MSRRPMLLIPAETPGNDAERLSSRWRSRISFVSTLGTVINWRRTMPVLNQGSSGPEVQDLQQKLKDLGFDPNGVEGNFGPGTKAAVIAVQQSQGLQADGIAGPATMAALQAASSSTSASTGGAVSGGSPPGTAE